MRRWIKAWTKSVRATLILIVWLCFSIIAFVIGYVMDDMVRAQGMVVYTGALTIIAMILILVGPRKGYRLPR